MTAIWAPSGRKRSEVPAAGPGPERPTGRQFVDDDFAIRTAARHIRRLSGLNFAEPTTIRPGSLTAIVPRIDVPHRQGHSGEIGGRQVAAVGTEAEHPDIAIASGRETSNLAIVGDSTLTKTVPSRNRMAYRIMEGSNAR